VKQTDLQSQSRMRAAAVVLAGTLAYGLPSWFLPYNHTPSWLVVGMTGMLAGAVGGSLMRGILRPTLCVAGGFAVACMARVVVDVIRDRTSHNLWPLEVAIVLVAGTLTGIVGVLIAWAARRQLAGAPGKPFG
jgi:hypothetical protein